MPDVNVAIFDAATAHSLFGLSLGAFLIPFACRPIRLPAAVGEILFGIAAGPYVLDAIHSNSFVELLGHLGFFFLMFIAGLELDFRQIEQVGSRGLVQNCFLVLLMLLWSCALVLALGQNPFLTLILSATSIGVLLVVLQETGLASSDFGQRMLLLGSIGEFILILLATGINSYATAGGFNLQLLLQFLELILVFVLAYGLLLTLRWAVWWKPRWFDRMTDARDPSEIGVRLGMCLLFVFVALTAGFKIDPILGAFLAGALFSFVFRAKGALESKFLTMGHGFFIPVFFITVGIQFNLKMALQGDVRLFLELFFLIFAVRLVAVFPLFWKGLPLRHTLAAAMLLSSPLTLLLVLADLGVKLEAIDPVMHATIVLVAVMTSVVYPFGFKLLARSLRDAPLAEAGK